MTVTRDFFTRVCPELTDSEITVLIEESLVMYKPNELYPQAVRVMARNLFPNVIPGATLIHIDGRDKIRSAINYLVLAKAELDKIPESKLTDTTGMTALDIHSCIFYLQEEVKALEAKDEIKH